MSNQKNQNNQNNQKICKGTRPLWRMIGQRLREFREAQHLEPGQLAECMNISREMVEEIEQGKLLPSIAHLVELSLELGLNPTWLITGSEHMLKHIAMECYDLDKHLQVPEVAEAILGELPQVRDIVRNKG